MMMVNPAGVVRQRLDKAAWPWALAVSGTAFTLFFLQTALDMTRSGRSSVLGAAALTFTGLIYGTFGVAVLALLAEVGHDNVAT